MCEKKGNACFTEQTECNVHTNFTEKKASSTLDPSVMLSLLLLKPLQIGLRSSGFIELSKKRKENETVI